MIHVQILIDNFHERHLGSPEVTNSFFFANDSRLKRARHAIMILLRLSRHDASTNMKHELLGSSRGLALKSNVELILKGQHA